MKSQQRLFAGTVMAIAVASVVAGCGSSGGKTATGGATAPSGVTTVADPTSEAAGEQTSPASSTSSSPTSSVGSGDINACSLLTVAKASALAGKTYTGATSSMIAPGQDQCSYTASDFGSSLVIIVYQPSSGVTFDMLSSVLSSVGTVMPVNGVGDKAIVGQIELDAQVGNRLIAVEGAGGILTGGTANAVAVAQAVVTALS